MKFAVSLKSKLPSLKSFVLAIFSAILLILAFPNFELWFLAWFALVPLFYAVEREKNSVAASFALGWIFGTAFFFGTCWWLAFPMYTYAGIPSPIAYALVLLATLTVGILPAIFAATLSLLLKRFGTRAIFAAPFLWTATEFLRFYVTGNNWNAIAYSQAFHPSIIEYANLGGLYLVGFALAYINAALGFFLLSYRLKTKGSPEETGRQKFPVVFKQFLFFVILPAMIFGSIRLAIKQGNSEAFDSVRFKQQIIAIQPNVPMSGLKLEDWQRLRERHVQLSERALQTQNLKTNDQPPTIIIFPESPMNFEYTRDLDFQRFLKDFTTKNNVSVLFNAAEPSAANGVYNSALMVNERGEKIAQYDKIHLLPFGEFVPLPDAVAGFVPPVVGTFEFGKTYDLLPFGAAQAGVMICFESHFPTLSRQYTLEGADVLVEMTNDGYLGDTGVLRQHLASAVFRAVETNRPVLRVTNVGITAFINERGEISDATEPYTEDTRVWTISKSDGAQTFYVRCGDWVAWVCVIVSLGFLALGFGKRSRQKITKDTS